MSLLRTKLEALHAGLMHAHRESAGFSSAVTGQEREAVNIHLLRSILPEGHRIGGGQIVDAGGRETGQVDAIIELPFSLSIPVLSAGAPSGNRLYLADTVAAAFEIKSDLGPQKEKAIQKIAEIKGLHRHRFVDGEVISGDVLRIQSYIIAFRGGPKSHDAIEDEFMPARSSSGADGVLLIENALFVGRRAGGGWYYGSGPANCLWAFFSCLSDTLKFLPDRNEFDLSEYSGLLS